VRMATSSGLTRPQLSSDLGVGLSTLNKCKRYGEGLRDHPGRDSCRAAEITFPFKVLADTSI
jgi:hypothetical protein